MQRAAGVSSFSDVSQLLSSAPRAVVELLRITAVVRSVTGPLGVTGADRLRINGTYALAGLAPHSGRGSSGGGEALGRLGRRLHVALRLGLLRAVVGAREVFMRSLLAALHIFGQDVMLG